MWIFKFTLIYGRFWSTTCSTCAIIFEACFTDSLKVIVSSDTHWTCEVCLGKETSASHHSGSICALSHDIFGSRKLLKVCNKKFREKYTLCSFNLWISCGLVWFGRGFINCLASDLLLCPFHKELIIWEMSLVFCQTDNLWFSFIMYCYWRV